VVAWMCVVVMGDWRAGPKNRPETRSLLPLRATQARLRFERDACRRPLPFRPETSPWPGWSVPACTRGVSVMCPYPPPVPLVVTFVTASDVSY